MTSPATSSRKFSSKSTANSGIGSGVGVGVGDDEDDDLILEREDSAWDVLGERLKRNAAEGRYLDLTSDDPSKDLGTVLSVEDATRAFEAMERPKADPSSMVPNGNASNGTEIAAAAVAAAGDGANVKDTHDDPVLAGLSTLIHDAVDELKKSRERLLQIMSGAAGKDGRRRYSSKRGTLIRMLKSLNQSMKAIQKYVNRHSKIVMGSTVTVERIERMNLLVFKANALITACNDRTPSTNTRRRSSSNGGKRKRNDVVDLTGDDDSKRRSVIKDRRNSPKNFVPASQLGRLS